MSSRYDEIMMKSKKFLPFHSGPLSEALISKAQEELNETDATRLRAISQIRELVLEEKNLKCRTEDAYLLQFLRARKFDVDKAFSVLRNKYQVKKAYGDVYDTFNMDDLRSLLQAKGGPACCLPYRDEDGCAVIIFQMGKWNPGDFNIATVLAAMTALILYAVEEEASQVSGVRILLDVKGASFRQARCLTPRYMNLLARALRNCLPVRFKGIHIYNENTIFKYLWSVLKLLLSEKIQNRVNFHGDNQKDLHKFIPKAILPAEYGGDNESFNNGEWSKVEMEKFYDNYKLMLSHGYKD